jgi:glycosyltransferase involved in cell wall biosynthesis
MSSQAPIFSVVMPAYNAERYVGEAIESVLAQTLPSWELLVVDDCSTDRTLEVCNSYRDPRIRVFTTPENLNAAGARNLALEHAQGEFVAFLDSDDVAVPDRLERQQATLRADPELGFLGSQVRLINERVVNSNHHWIYPAEDGVFKATMLFRCPFLMSTIATRASLLQKMDGQVFEQDFAPSEDYHFAARMMGLCKFRNDTEPLVHYRLHSGQLIDAKADLIGCQMQKVQKLILGFLGIEATTQDIETYRLCSSGPVSSWEQLCFVQRWLERIYHANLAAMLIPDKGIRPILGVAWFHLCKLYESRNLHLYNKFKSSELSRFYLSRRNRLRFFIECALCFRGLNSQFNSV